MIRGGLLLLCACGRIGFDPLATGDDQPAADANVAGDAATDGAPSACQSAMVVGVGRTAPLDTCAAGDRIDGCAGPGVADLVFEFTAPTSRGYNFAAKNPGTDNVSNSVARVDSACATTSGSCAGILSFALNAGDTVHLVVEAASGSCTTIELEIQ